MIWTLALITLGGLALYLAGLFLRGDIRQLVRALRWLVGGAIMIGAAFLVIRGQVMVASLLAAAGVGVITRGRLGPIDFGAGRTSPNNISSVKSTFLAMTLDHDSGTVSGKVRSGQFSGRDLDELGPQESWALYQELEQDPESLALYKSWLNVNREGWQDYFAQEFGMDADDGEKEEDTRPISSVDEAYDILGLTPGASESEIRASYRALIKKMHPDAGGSAFLAARINEAKDLLLKHISVRR